MNVTYVVYVLCWYIHIVMTCVQMQIRTGFGWRKAGKAHSNTLWTRKLKKLFYKLKKPNLLTGSRLPKTSTIVIPGKPKKATPPIKQ